jgi:N-acetyl-anhydromuramyl-L-alanine amidase AmpD
MQLYYKKKSRNMVFNESLKLDDKLYFKEKAGKKIIVLHHTVSKREAGAEGVVRWWNQSGRPVATPFVIDTNGNIYRCFDEQYWSYHTGLGKWFDMVSIGIELVNEGPLVLKGDKYLTTFGSIYTHQVYTFNGIWRGYIHFAFYPDKQVESLAKLVLYLCEKYNIKRSLAVSDIFTYTSPQDVYKNGGIIAHSTVRADKTDVSVAFPLDKFLSFLR